MVSSCQSEWETWGSTSYYAGTKKDGTPWYEKPRTGRCARFPATVRYRRARACRLVKIMTAAEYNPACGGDSALEGCAAKVPRAAIFVKGPGL